MNYLDVIETFKNLRQKGTSLSSIELEIINAWEEKYPPELILEFLYIVQEDFKEKGKNFPQSLMCVDKLFQKYYKKRCLLS